MSEALSLRFGRSTRTNPLRQPFDPSPCHPCHGDEAGRMRNDGRFWRGSSRNKREQSVPEIIPRLKTPACICYIADYALTTFVLYQSGDFLRLIPFRANHGSTETQGLRAVSQGRIQQCNGEFLI